jgi:sterol desaturase/sphingolipid hydroxylase (fatty acid hydroxylase superfamily)
MVNSVEQLVILISTPIYVLLIGGEWLISHYLNRKLYGLKDTLMNVYFMLANMGVDLLMRGITLFVLLGMAQFAFVKWAEKNWIYWTLLFLLEDLAFYWLHRADHMVRLFWAIHVTHHSSEDFNFTTGFRSSVFQPVYRFVWFIPIVLLGFSPIDIFVMYAITQTYGIIVHTQGVKKLGVLEYFFVTPSHHRVHHASNVRYLDKNMGMILIIWDKLFGTFQEEVDEDPVVFGLYEKKAPVNPVGAIFHEWQSIWKDIQKAPTWRDKWNYLTQPPGWSHDGTTLTADQLREQGNKRES